MEEECWLHSSPTWRRSGGSWEVSPPPLPKIFPFLSAETRGLIGTALAVSFQRHFIWDGTDGNLASFPSTLVGHSQMGRTRQVISFS